MNRDDIIRMAWQAFSDPAKEDAWRNGFWTVTQEELDDFAALVAAAEREACAKLCDDIRYDGYVPPEDGAASYYYNDASIECAAAIRARGKK